MEEGRGEAGGTGIKASGYKREMSYHQKFQSQCSSFPSTVSFPSIAVKRCEVVEVSNAASFGCLYTGDVRDSIM